MTSQRATKDIILGYLFIHDLVIQILVLSIYTMKTEKHNLHIYRPCALPRRIVSNSHKRRSRRCSNVQQQKRTKGTRASLAIPLPSRSSPRWLQGMIRERSEAKVGPAKTRVSVRRGAVIPPTPPQPTHSASSPPHHQSPPPPTSHPKLSFLTAFPLGGLLCANRLFLFLFFHHVLSGNHRARDGRD